MELLSRKGRCWLPVLTGSMSPLIHPGDQVLVAKVPAEQICSGDIAVFRRDGNIVVHRVLKKRRTARGIRFEEKGDSANTYGVIGADRVLGRVVMVKAGGKVLGLSSPFSRFVSFALSAWFYSTTAVVAMLRSSTRRNIRRAGKALSLFLRFFSNVLVRICCLIWYLSGLLAKRNADLN